MTKHFKNYGNDNFPQCLHALEIQELQEEAEKQYNNFLSASMDRSNYNASKFFLSRVNEIEKELFNRGETLDFYV